MKDLTYEEFINAPKDVQALHILASTKTPIGSSLYEKTIKEHPEYFPEEIEHRRKYDLIPQEVHDAYWEGREVLDDELLKSNKGILNLIHNTEAKKEWDEAYAKFSKEEKALHKKHYSKYGI